MPFGAPVQPFGVLGETNIMTGCGRPGGAGTISGVAADGHGSYREVHNMDEWGRI
jgi:hypothetical protein